MLSSAGCCFPSTRENSSKTERCRRNRFFPKTHRIIFFVSQRINFVSNTLKHFRLEYSQYSHTRSPHHGFSLTNHDKTHPVRNIKQKIIPIFLDTNLVNNIIKLTFLQPKANNFLNRSSWAHSFRSFARLPNVLLRLNARKQLLPVNLLIPPRFLRSLWMHRLLVTNLRLGRKF